MTKLIEITGKAISGEWGNDDTDGTGIPVLRTTNFTNDGVINFNSVVTRSIAKKNLEEKYLQRSDIIIEKSGGSTDQPVGRVVYFDAEENKYLFNNFTGVLRIKDKSTWFPRYVFWALYYNYRIGGTKPYQNKTTGLHNLQTEQYICNTEIHETSYIGQKRIAAILDKVDVLISLRKKQLQKLDDLVKSRFAEMFGDVIDEDTLLNLCNIIDYRGKTPDKANAGLPFITAKNVKKHHLSLEPREYITKETYDKVMTRGFPREGDVIFTTEAPLGNMCRLPRFETEFYVGQRIVTLQTKKLNPAYLEYALDTTDFQTKLFEKSSGSTVTGIRVRLLEQLTILVPSREVQDRFAAFVDAIEKNKRDVQQALDKLEQMKQALMQKYFG